MTRLIGPDDAVRMLVLTAGSQAGTFVPPGTAVPLYADAQASVPADVRSTTGDVIAGSPAPEVLVTGAWQIPLFQYPDGVDTVYTRVLGGPVVALYARDDDRLDALQTRMTAAETGVAAAATVTALNAEAAARAAADNTVASAAATDATSKANAAQAGAISTAAIDATSKASAAQQAATTAGVGAAAGLAIVFGGI